MILRCDGRESCSIHSTNVVFGDPCPDTYKYTEIHYQCVKGRFVQFVLTIQ